MNCWQILGIEPTVDIKEIKKAYAIKLKIFHPEDNPQQFQQLREAYDQALKEAPYLKEVESYTDDFSDDSQEDAEYLYPPKVEFIPSSSESKGNSSNMINEFCRSLENIYSNFNLRIDINEWNKLLQNSIHWSIDERREINDNLLTFLMDNSHLPQKVWILLNNHFFWSEELDALYDDYPEQFIDFILEKIKSIDELSFDFIQKTSNLNHDEFLSFRENAYYALKENDLEDAFYNLDSAYKLFSYDPDLLRLMGIYYMRIGSTDLALEAFSHLIGINSKDIDGYINRAHLLLDIDIASAYYDIKAALELDPENLTALNLLANYFFLSNNYFEAKLLYEQIFDLCPYDIEVGIKLIEINWNLIEKYSKEIQSKPEDTSIRFSLASTYFELDCFTECCKTIEELSYINSLNSDNLLLYARALAKQDRIPNSINYLNEALRLAGLENKNGYQILIERGTINLEQEIYEAAIEDFNAALKINQYDAELLHKLADASRCADRLEECINYSNAAIKLNPSVWYYYSTRGLAYYKLKNYSAARDDHEIVLDHKYDFYNAWYRKGYCHLQLHEFEKAVHSLKKASDWSSGRNTNIYFYLAVAYFMVEDFVSALDTINIYIDKEPEDFDGYLLCGDIYRSFGNHKLAKDYYITANSKAPDLYRTAKAAAYYHLLDGEFQDAFNILAKVCYSNLNDDWIIMNLLWASIEVKDWSEANFLLKRYKADDPNSENIDPYILFYIGAISYYIAPSQNILARALIYKAAVLELKKAVEVCVASDALSYLSLIYFETGDLNNAVLYAENALKADPNNIDYKTRYEGILSFRQKKTSFSLFKGKPSSHKLWPSTQPIQHHKLEPLPALSFIIGRTL